jgi:hypothetical protein
MQRYSTVRGYEGTSTKGENRRKKSQKKKKKKEKRKGIHGFDPILVIAFFEDRERERENGDIVLLQSLPRLTGDDIDTSWSFRCHNVTTELHFLILLETSV